MMLNKVGVSNKMEMIDKPFQKLRSGCGFVLGEEEFENVRPISEGGFARVYSARRGDTLKAIKVGVACLWQGVCTGGLECRFRVRRQSGR